jgi:hypothetical protein
MRERALDIRVAPVAAGYEALAHKADLKYSGAPHNQNCLVLALLRSLPLVIVFAEKPKNRWRALGGWSREVGRFIADIGEKGSENPERFGYCHCMRQAQGAI